MMRKLAQIGLVLVLPVVAAIVSSTPVSAQNCSGSSQDALGNLATGQCQATPPAPGDADFNPVTGCSVIDIQCNDTTVSGGGQSTGTTTQNGGTVISPPDISPLKSQSITNPSSSTFQSLLSAAFVVIGAIAVIIVIIGAIKYAGSQGDPAGTNAARNTIIYALVGLAIVILAASIVNFVFQRLAS